MDLQETQDPAAGWYGKGFPEPIRILVLPTASWPEIQKHTAKVASSVNELKPGDFIGLNF